MERNNMIDRLIGAYNRAHGVRCSKKSERTRAIVNEAIEVGGEEAFFNREIANFVSNPDFSTNIKEAFIAYTAFKRSGNSTPVEAAKTPVEAQEAPAAPSIPSAPENSVETAVGGALGLLERTLAEVIVNTQGANIAERIVGDLSERVDSYIRETYGALPRKVEI